MYREIYEKIQKILNPTKCKMIFYNIFHNLYKKEITNLINELDILLNRAKNTNNFDECLNQTVYFLLNVNEIEKCIYYLYQGVLYYNSIKDVSNQFKTLNKISEICQNNSHIRNIEVIMYNCNKDLSILLEDNFEIDEALKYLHIARSIVKKYNLDIAIIDIDYKISSLYITRNLFVIASEYLSGVIFYKKEYILTNKECQIIIMYILTLLAKLDSINYVKMKLNDICQKYVGFYDSDDYILIINIISCVDNLDNEHFIYETHRFVQKYKDDIFRYLFLIIKKNISFYS
jgi:hypothetical protein